MNKEAFLDKFFGDGNLIDRAKAESTPALQELVADLTEELETPTVLPRRTDNGPVEWFVFCGDDAALRRAQAEVQAFVGPAYGRWEGVRADLDPDDPVERALIDFAAGRVIRFRTESDSEFKEGWNAIKLMREVWRQRPAIQRLEVRTGAALVRDFELATAAGDSVTAADRLAEIRRRGLLGSENLRFLEIRQAAAEGRWAEIADSPDLPDLARIRRPWLVTEDLLTALYRARLASFETSGDVQGAVASARRLLERLPELFSARGPLRSADVTKAFALRFAVPGAEDEARIRGLLDGAVLDAGGRAWLSAVADAVARPPIAEPDAREALAAGDIEAAFELARRQPPTARRAELLVECAFELQTLDSAEEAIDALGALADSERQGLLERRLIAVALSELSELVQPSRGETDTLPRTWTSWLKRLLDDPGWQAADLVAALGELEYAAEDLSDPGAAVELSDLMLAAADSEQRDVLRDALPRIVGWLERQGPDPALARPVHQAVLTVVALDSAWGEASLEVAYNSTEGLLRSGLDERGYVDLLEQLELLWDRMASRAYAAWLADLLELLELYPGSRDALIRFVAASARPVLAFADRLDPAIAEATQRSCEAIGAPELAEAIRARAKEREEPGGVADDVLSGRLVGIYTLTPQVAVRAREAIERRFPGVRVQVDSSQVSTSSLEHLAATADYLIVSIRSAKHAATDAITRHRPREMPTLIPRGRGSSRMVETLVAAVESAA